jgi:hypothetical protein
MYTFQLCAFLCTVNQTSPGESIPHHLLSYNFSEFVSFEVFMVVTLKNTVFWDINPSSSLTGDTLLLHYRAQPVNAM